MATASLEKVRTDFDRIASLLEPRAEPAELYEPFLLRHVPAGCASALDVGCGAGRMARLLASRSSRVVGIDASPRMIELARARSTHQSGVEFLCADFMTHSFEQTFDCVMSMTTWHHLPAATSLEKLKSLVNPGGTLVIHDIRQFSGASDWVWSGARAVATGQAWLWAKRYFGERGELSRAWRDHGAGEHYLRMADARSLGETHLPGARTYNHALWRYTIVWHNSR